MASCRVHPLSTALFLLGYAIALPIAAKMTVVVERQNRLALFGHQAGIMIAMVGWVLRGSILVAVGHGLWLLVAYGWFTYFGPGRRAVEAKLKSRKGSRSGRSTRRGGSNG